MIFPVRSTIHKLPMDKMPANGAPCAMSPDVPDETLAIPTFDELQRLIHSLPPLSDLFRLVEARQHRSPRDRGSFR